jgi:hypothetical protein
VSTLSLIEANFKTRPWFHQMREFELSADLPERALLWQMRTGKTKAIIDTGSHLSRDDKVDTIIIFAPNGVHANWVERELPVHMWDDVPYHALAWRTRVAGLKLTGRLTKADVAAWDDARADWWRSYEVVRKSPELTIISFNSESMTRPDVRKALKWLLNNRRCMVVWDESTDFRSPGSARSKMARSIALKVPYRRILDGTALTNSPLHAFAQFELLKKGALGFTKNADFKDFFAEFESVRGLGGRMYPRLKTYKNLDILQERMAPYSSVVLRSDCHDLPPIDVRRRPVAMSPEQKRVYREVLEQTEVDVGDGTIAHIGALTSKIMKLQQVSSGYIVDKGKQVRRIPGPNPWLDAVSEEVYLAPGKVIVWCMFQQEIDDVVHRLRDVDGHEIMEYHGRVPDEDKRSARNHFNTNGAKVLIGQPQAGGRGVEFSGADMVINASHVFNAIIRLQANERATKMGGGNVRILDFVSSPTDTYILDSLESNVNIADQVAGRGMQDFLRRAKL